MNAANIKHRALGVLIAVVFAVSLFLASPAGAAATFVNAWYTQNGDTVNSSLTGATGNAIQVNDLLIGVIAVNQSSSLPSGFTNIVNGINAAGAYLNISYKVAVSGDINATFSFSNDGAAYNCGIAAFRGAATTSVVDTNGAGNTGSSNAPAAASITLGNSGDILLWAVGNQSTGTPTVPSGFSTAFIAAPSSSFGAGLGYILGASSGATGIQTGTLGGVSAQWATVLIGINVPAATGLKGFFVPGD